MLIIFLLVTLFRGRDDWMRNSSGDPLGGRGRGGPAEQEAKLRHCPICSHALQKTEKVKSVLYPGTTDRLMEIYGCPHCYPSGRSSPRICSVCKKRLQNEDIIFARFFPRQKGAHVHVLGCSQCYTRKHGR